MKEIGIGLLGLGTVGGGVAELLASAGERIAARAGVRPVLRRAAERDPAVGLDLGLDPALRTTEAQAVIDDPAVQVVVELIGGVDVALALVRAALRAGKPVVTANKALLAHHGAELFAESRAHGAPIYFEASVGGGIPVLRALREGLIANRIESILGIVNGTCNYILTRMEEQHSAYADTLAAARTKGYAEADPSLDVDGWDTAHKTVVLAALAFGAWVPLERVPRRGISDLPPRAIELAAALNRRVKLLAILRDTPAGLDLAVEPCLVPANGALGGVGGVFNAVWVRAAPVGDTLYTGRGAGRPATASAVLGDIAEAAGRLAFGGGPPPGLPAGDTAARLAPPGAAESAHGLWVSFPDARAFERTEAALAVLAGHGMHVREAHAVRHADGGGSSLAITCRPVAARTADAAAAALAGLPGAEPKPARLRMEDA